MYYDIFKIEMRERYRHVEEESDDKDEPQSNMENDVEIEGSDELRKGYHCEQCKFIGKTEAGLKTHRTVKHRRKSGSCNVWFVWKTVELGKRKRKEKENASLAQLCTWIHGI